MALILLVEDQLLTRMGMKMALNNPETDCEIVAETGSVQEALDIIDQGTPIELILLDLTLTDGSGIEIVKYVKPRYPDIKILVISAETSNEVIENLVGMGIEGFISKYADVPVLLTAIDSVMSGLEYFGKDISEIIHSVKTIRETAEQQFTERELEIIQLCAQGYPARAIAEKLEISKRTVESHKNNIFKKLGFSTTSELIHFAFQHGITKANLS
ncbi:MAG: response regulator transcription factor [Bacteroidales bacterium]|nr:response regulator transcription factor [Bacteroidales bacterium]